MSARSIPAPPTNVEVQDFWDACNDGKLMLPRCGDTGQVFWYPRKVSPFTLSGNVEMVEAAGTGEIYTYSVMRRANPQYAIGYVRLDEGVTLMTNFVDCDFDSLSIGMKVKAVFVEAENGQKVPCFTPV